MNKEALLMESVELSAEHRAFQAAARALAGKIRTEAARLSYDLPAALTLVEGGNLTVHVLHGNLADEPFLLAGLPAEVGLFLTGNACGGLFPQAPETV